MSKMLKRILSVALAAAIAVSTMPSMLSYAAEPVTEAVVQVEDVQNLPEGTAVSADGQSVEITDKAQAKGKYTPPDAWTPTLAPGLYEVKVRMKLLEDGNDIANIDVAKKSGGRLVDIGYHPEAADFENVDEWVDLTFQMPLAEATSVAVNVWCSGNTEYAIDSHTYTKIADLDVNEGTIFVAGAKGGSDWIDGPTYSGMTNNRNKTRTVKCDPFGGGNINRNQDLELPTAGYYRMTAYLSIAEKPATSSKISQLEIFADAEASNDNQPEVKTPAGETYEIYTKDFAEANKMQAFAGTIFYAPKTPTKHVQSWLKYYGGPAMTIHFIAFEPLSNVEAVERTAAKKNEADYMPSSWTTFQAAVDEIKAGINQDSTQEQVQAALNAIDVAAGKLVPKNFDTITLEAETHLQTTGEGDRAEKYTDEDASGLQTIDNCPTTHFAFGPGNVSLAPGKYLIKVRMKLKNANEDTSDPNKKIAKWDPFWKTMDGTAQEGGDKVVEIKMAGFSADAYYDWTLPLTLTESIKELQTRIVYQGVQLKLDKIIIERDEVAYAKDELNAGIAQAETVQKGDYNDTTWNAFQAAIAAAKAEVAKDDATVASLTEKGTALQNAYGALKTNLEAAKAELQALVDAITAKNYTATGWTTESWDAFDTALTNAKNELNNGDATADSLNEKKDALAAAEKALVFDTIVVGPDKMDAGVQAGGTKTDEGIRTNAEGVQAGGDGASMFDYNFGALPAGQYQFQMTLKLESDPLETVAGGDVLNVDTFSDYADGEGFGGTQGDTAKYASWGRHIRANELKKGESVTVYYTENFVEAMSKVNLRMHAYKGKNGTPPTLLLQEVKAVRLGDAFDNFLGEGEGRVFSIEATDSQRQTGTATAEGVVCEVGEGGCALHDNYLNRAVAHDPGAVISAGRWLLNAQMKISEKPETSKEVAAIDVAANVPNYTDLFAFPVIKSDDFAAADTFQGFSYVANLPENAKNIQLRFQNKGNVKVTFKRITAKYLGVAIDEAVMTAFNEKLAEMKALTKSDYTEESWNAANIEALLAEAEALPTKVGTTADDFTGMTTKLEEAKGKLVETDPVVIAKNALKTLIDECDALEAENYSENSFAFLTRALAQAKEVYESATTADELNAAVAMLQKAKDALKASVSGATNTFKMADYSICAGLADAVAKTTDGENNVVEFKAVAGEKGYAIDTLAGPVPMGKYTMTLRVKLLEAFTGSERVLNIDNWNHIDGNAINTIQVGEVSKDKFGAVGEWTDIVINFTNDKKDYPAQATYRLWFDRNVHFLLDTITVKPVEEAVIDVTALEAALAEIDKLKAEEYTEASWDALAKKVAEAKALLVDPATTQSAVTSMVTALNSAKNGLEKLATAEEIKVLTDLIASYANLKKDDYTTATWTAYETKLKAAKELAESEKPGAKAIDTMVKELTAAKNALKPAGSDVDTSKLSALIATCEALKKADYTEASWNKLQTALTVAKAALNAENKTQATIDAAVKALQEAKDALVSVNKNGWKFENKVWYYYINGVKQTGWERVSGKWYFLGSDGKMQTGWINDGGKWYFTESSGKMVTGWKQLGKWYFFDNSGAMKTGWIKSGSKWYFTESSGKMVTGWKQLGKWYFFDNSGAMKTGWIKSGSKWYFTESSGKMVTGWKKISNKWYFFNNSGAMKTGWYQVGGKWYFSESSGKMLTGWKKLGSKWYFFAPSGAMKTGWVKAANKWYYMDGSGRMIASTSRKIGKKTYRFNASGVCLNP